MKTPREELLDAITEHLVKELGAPLHEQDWEPRRIADEILDICGQHVLPQPDTESEGPVITGLRPVSGEEDIFGFFQQFE